MGKIFITVGNLDDYLGIEPFKLGSLVKLQKDLDNKKDSEAIKVIMPNIGKVGYVANGSDKSLGTYSAGRIFDLFESKIYGKVCFLQDDAVIVKLKQLKNNKNNKKYIEASLRGIIAEGNYPSLNKKMRKIFSFYRHENSVKNYNSIAFDGLSFENLPYEQLKASIDGYYSNNYKTAARLGLWAKQITNILRQVESALVFGDKKFVKSRLKMVKVAMSCFCDALALIDEDINVESTNDFMKILDSYDEYNQKQN